MTDGPILRLIGYGGRSRSDLIERLRGAGVEAVVDLRFKPGGREGFRREHLRNALEEEGIAYHWVQAFGNRNYRGGPTDLVDPARGVKKVAPLIRESRVALLCACRYTADCHRNEVAATLQQAVPGLRLRRLGENGA